MSKRKTAKDGVPEATGSGTAVETPSAEVKKEDSQVQVRRPPGQKEIPPLVWKLVGTSAGTPVTLLKCIEREDAESQMERLASERYYENLAILPIDAPMPMTAAMVKAHRETISRALKEADEKAQLKASRKSSAAGRTSSAKSNSSTSKKKSAKKTVAAKSTKRSAKKSTKETKASGVSKKKSKTVKKSTATRRATTKLEKKTSKSTAASAKKKKKAVRKTSSATKKKKKTTKTKRRS